MRKIKGVLYNPFTEELKVVEVDANLEGYYKVLNCEMIEVITREFSGKRLVVICDENGLFKSNNKVAIATYDKSNKDRAIEQIVGNVLIVDYFTEDEDFESLNDEEINAVFEAFILMDGSGHRVLMATV